MARAAGDDTHYTFTLQGNGNGRQDVSIRLPSVTTIIGTVFKGSFTTARNYGFNLGLRAAFPHMSEGEFEILKKTAYEGELGPDQILKVAQDRGTLAHDYFEALANMPVLPSDFEWPTPAPEPINGYHESILKWWDSEMKGWEVVSAEGTVVSVEHQFAGTVDLIRKRVEASEVRGPTEPKPSGPLASTIYEVLDLKTHSGSARYEDRLQVAAYELAAREMGLVQGNAPCQHRVVLAREDGKKASQSTKYTDPAEFLQVLKVYKQMKGGK